MNKKALLFLSVLLTLTISMIGFLSVNAQDGGSEVDPNIWQSDTSNWCDAGNVWGDGRCNTGNEEQTQWMYEFGWWWQRLTEGDISACQIPQKFGGNCGGGDVLELVIDTPAGPVTIVIYLTGEGGTSNNYFTGEGIEVQDDYFDYSLDAVYIGLDPSNTNGVLIYGNDNPNYIVGSDGDDAIVGNGGDDVIYGGDGDDFLLGDVIYGEGTGNDSLFGGAGNDVLVGDVIGGDGTGSDTLVGGPGNDVLAGEWWEYEVNSTNDGDDVLYGDDIGDNSDPGVDDLFGDGGSNTCDGGGDGDYVDC